jgi:dihydrofolate synthase / folylpolyglutamate synthase
MGPIQDPGSVQSLIRNPQSAIRNPPMDYRESIAYLERFGNEVLTMKFGLDTIGRILAGLGDPQFAYPSVLIAGTNGKGSVAGFLSSILTRGGYRTALYTSPHLVRPEERFVVDDAAIGPEDFARCLTRVVEAIDRAGLESRPTYFETLTALAFLYFAEERVDAAVLEVGMGGRLDSTNVVDPAFSIITPVGLDHQKFLGETIREIAGEKAGIIHSRRPVLISRQRPEARKVIINDAASKGAPLFELDEAAIQDVYSLDGRYSFRFRGAAYHLQMYGRHQVENAALAVQAAQLLNEAGFQLSDASMRAGIGQAYLKGRLQQIGTRPLVFLDGAHNRDAAENLAAFIREHTQVPRHLVLAMMRDKEIDEVLKIFKPLFETIYLTVVPSARSASLEDLLRLLPKGVPVPDPEEALRQAKSGAQTVVVSGSFYLVGNILAGLRENLRRDA